MTGRRATVVATSIPIAITTPETAPMIRYPVVGSSVTPRSAGPPAPNSRIENVSTTTRQVSRLVRSSYAGVSSAGSAMYGTWNRLNAVAVSRNAISTQIAPTTAPRAGGTAKVSAKSTAIEHAPISMSRLRVPCRARSRSVSAPITGSITTSQTFAVVITAPAARAATPSESVR